MATPRRHANVLMHMAGYFKTVLDPPAKVELLATIDDYRGGLVPLVVPCATHARPSFDRCRKPLART